MKTKRQQLECECKHCKDRSITDVVFGKMRPSGKHAKTGSVYWMRCCTACGRFKINGLFGSEASVTGVLPHKIKALEERCVFRYLRRYIPKKRQNLPGVPHHARKAAISNSFRRGDLSFTFR